MNVFKTIAKPTEGIYKEKGSKFLAFAFPVTTEAEVKNHLEQLHKTCFDARHHCYAYILGLRNQQYRANDDGEPNHSAGDPILGQIRSRELTNCLVVVVRYFGGIKLGVGGLIHAYKTAADEALAQTELVILHSKSRFQLTFEYMRTSDVERVLSEFQIDFLEKSFTTNCRFDCQIKDDELAILTARLEPLYDVKFEQTEGL